MAKKKGKKTEEQRSNPDSESQLGFSRCPRPKTSPLVTFRVGPELKEYYVSQSLLQSAAWVYHYTSLGNAYIDLHFVDSNTGHVLVHYLYTGTYQTLANTGASTTEETVIEFQRAISTYMAAKFYLLTGLQQLAIDKIEQLGVGMKVPDILGILYQESWKLPSNTSWFYRHLDGVGKAAFEGYYKLFADSALKRPRHADSNKDMIRYMVELYTSPVANIHNDNVGIVQETLQQPSSGPESDPTENFPPNSNPGEHPIQEAIIESDPAFRVSAVAATTQSPEELHALDTGALHPSSGLAATISEEYVSPLNADAGFQLMGNDEHPSASADGTMSKAQKKKKKKREQIRLESEQKMNSHMSPLFSCASPRAPADCGSGRLDHPTLAVFDPHTSQTPPRRTDATSTTSKRNAVKLCPDRAEHLLHSNLWRSCRPCHDVVRQLALQLALLDDADEYEVVERVIT
ncbi:hypothetical protein T440DRAFT_555760 [Plenodomus tracheiphilus IPT5]|uniref:BTB domain-containing protein n=1 Tax=Plenodomus tracheiphilus IPT5 TaxID=1408161 RepID=A0A6A7B4S5_9PLEO|nr:hypothetical protein T440DRAFT_555760 [Plenodomus tracheiphilus IPT5]